MKKRLNGRETLLIATMLFGMFFGAGNLIFPVYMSQLAGRNIWKAIAGFIITGVSMPLLGVAAIGVSRSNGLFELSSKVSRPYGYFFTCALYLSIGPFFAIPRCATVPFTVAVSGLLPAEEQGLALAVFSLIFFALVLGFSLNPGKILTYVGKVLTPVFLVFLAILVVMALVNPVVDVAAVEPQGNYVAKSFFTGFLEGYNTMDMLASLAFGIVVINVLRSLGVNEPQDIARSTAKAGFFSCLIMAVIYVFVTLMGAQSSGMGVACANGGEVLSVVASHYFGRAGALILAATVTLACLKTSVGLVTSCAETFVALFPKGPRYRVWAVIFSVLSFLVANLGLNAIIDYSLPVLMLLYPLAITLGLLGLLGGIFQHDRAIYASVTFFTLIAALFDFFKALPKPVIGKLHLQGAIDFAEKALPFFDLSVGWLCPAIVGLAVGVCIRLICRKHAAAKVNA